MQGKYEHNLKQLEMFNGVKKLLELKMTHNEQILKGGVKEEVIGTETQDILVL